MLTSSAPARPVDVLERFASAVAADPGRTAVVAPDRTLTFADLETAVADAAGQLAARGIGPGSLVGLALRRSADQIIAILAVLRAGAAYLPLDPGYPAARLEFMVADAGVDLLLTGDDARPAWAGEVLCQRLGPAGSAAEPVRAPTSADPAYVIYTSGSTGRPKGVVVGRAALAHLLTSLEQGGVYPDESAVVAWNASVSFDASVQQWLRVCRGDTLVVLSEQLRLEPAQLGDYLREHGVTDLDTTPSHWAVLAEHWTPAAERTGPLRLLIGGEPLPERMWEELSAARSAGLVAAVNLYGPTETTVDATAAAVTSAGPHIGTPLPGVVAHVLDDRLRPVLDGEVGELYLGGSGVAIGYLNRPGLTAQRFVPDLTGAGRVFRTGDLVRRRVDGNLDFLGRVDRQVKISGLRVELGEIEDAVRAHPAVSTAVVLARDGAGGQRLVAWYTGRDGDPPAASEVRDAAASRLPTALVPVAFIPVPGRLPRTANGKLDVAALPDLFPDGPVSDTDDIADEAEPTGPIEPLIAEAWREVLGRDRVLATDDFFTLGGHSLMALKVVTTLRRRLGMVVPTKMVYRHPRLRDLAAELTSRLSDG
jgi:amino acid adenylation domain-containing protein